MRITLRAAAAVAALILTTGLAGCGESTDASDDPTSTGSPTDQAASLTVTDPWAKAAETGMTGAFGELVNDTDHDITVTGGESDAASMIELHETVDKNGTMVMQQKEGGFVIAAGETLTLEPGGNHIMLMGLTRALAPGDDVTITLKLDDGSTVDMTATVKEFAGGNENYDGGGMTEGHTP